MNQIKLADSWFKRNYGKLIAGGLAAGGLGLGAYAYHKGWLNNPNTIKPIEKPVQDPELKSQISSLQQQVSGLQSQIAPKFSRPVKNRQDKIRSQRQINIRNRPRQDTIVNLTERIYPKEIDKVDRLRELHSQGKSNTPEFEQLQNYFAAMPKDTREKLFDTERQDRANAKIVAAFYGGMSIGLYL